MVKIEGLQENFIRKESNTELFNKALINEGFQKKALATKFAINELKLNRWNSGDVDYQEIYKIVWLEKLMFIEMSYSIADIKEAADKILINQYQMISTLGLIVSMTGEILENQTIIITKLDEVIINTETIIANTEEIIDNQEKYLKNGVTIKDEREESGGGETKKSTNTWVYMGVGVAVLVVLYIVMSNEG